MPNKSSLPKKISKSLPRNKGSTSTNIVHNKSQQRSKSLSNQKDNDHEEWYGTEFLKVDSNSVKVGDLVFQKRQEKGKITYFDCYYKRKTGFGCSGRIKLKTNDLYIADSTKKYCVVLKKHNEDICGYYKSEPKIQTEKS